MVHVVEGGVLEAVDGLGQQVGAEEHHQDLDHHHRCQQQLDPGVPRDVSAHGSAPGRPSPGPHRHLLLVVAADVDELGHVVVPAANLPVADVLILAQTPAAVGVRVGPDSEVAEEEGSDRFVDRP